MQITLRKANALQISINELVKSLNFTRSVSLNEFQDAEAVITSENEKLTANINRRASLNKALYEIRKLVSAANVNAGIDDVLADIALLEKDIMFFYGLAKESERLDPIVLKGKLEKLANRKEETYYGEQTVATSLLTAEDIKGYNRTVSKLKKQKQKLQDELLELNVRTTIALSEETVATLTSEEVI